MKLHEKGLRESRVGNPIEIVVIDRRHFLKLAGGTLISLSGLALIGCGGGGGGTSGGLGQVRGAVHMPGGSSLDVSTLTINNGFGSGKVSKSGGFSLGAASIPSLAFVTNSTNNVILFGFVDPATSNNTINATSIAIALIYFGLDAYMIEGSATRELLALIAQEPATLAFAQVVTTRMAANPLALDASDPQMCAALGVALSTIKGGMAGARPQLTFRSPPSDTQLLVNGGTQSGFDVNQGGSNTAIVGVNQRRRWCKMYVYETATVDSSGVTTTLSTPKPIGSSVSVGSTEALGLFTSLADVLTKTSPFSPVSSASIPLALESGASQTIYDVIVLGSSGSTKDPSFYSDPKYAAELAGWLTDHGNLNLRTALFDILMAVVLAMIGVGGIATFSDASIDAALAELESIGDAAWQTAIQAAVSGKDPRGPLVKAAAYMLAGASVPSTTAFLSAMFNACEKLNVIGTAAKGAAISEARLGVILGFGFKVILGALTGASLVLGAGDLAAVLKDFSSSDVGDLWTAAVVLPPIHLNPVSASIIPGSTTPTSFTVSTAAGVTGTFVWTWTLTGGVTAQLTDEALPTVHKGAILTHISATTVYLLTTASDINNMTLTVEGFSSGTGGVLTSIGKTQAAITIGMGATKGSITPGIATIPFGSEQGTGIVYTVYGFFTFKPLTNLPPASTYYFELADGTGIGGTGNYIQSDASETVPVLTAGLAATSNSITSAMTYKGGAVNMGGGLVGICIGGVNWAAPGVGLPITSEADAAAQMVQTMQTQYAGSQIVWYSL